MRRLLFIVIAFLLIPSVSFAGWVQYGLVRGGAIYKRVSVDEADALKIGKLVAHGYVKITEQAMPKYDSRVEVIIPSEDVTSDGVEKTYTVKPIPLNDAIARALRRVDEIAANRIKGVFDDKNRNTKILAILNKRDTIVGDIKAAKSIEDLKAIKEEL